MTCSSNIITTGQVVILQQLDRSCDPSWKGYVTSSSNITTAGHWTGYEYATISSSITTAGHCDTCDAVSLIPYPQTYTIHQ